MTEPDAELPSGPDSTDSTEFPVPSGPEQDAAAAEPVAEPAGERGQARGAAGAAAAAAADGALAEPAGERERERGAESAAAVAVDGAVAESVAERAGEPGAQGAAGRRHGVGVRVADLCRTFTPGGAPPLAALDHVSLDVPAGSTVALTGPSGSGKSTLLHVIGAIERADSGSVRVGEVEVTGVGRAALSAYRQSIGFVFQRFHLLPALTVLDNVTVPLLAHGGRARRRGGAARAAELIAAVGLAGREHALPSQLSGGQQQRVAIARALITDPGLLLADEPTGNLDSANGTAVIELLLSLNADYGTTLLIATHDPAIAARCARAVTLTDGRIRSDTAALADR